MSAKVVHKSCLLNYRNKDQQTKAYFHLGVADETASMNVVVYRGELYEEMVEGSCWMFREVLFDGQSMKVTRNSHLAKVAPLCIPDELEQEARMLITSQGPTCSITKVRASAEKTTVCVGGSVTEVRVRFCWCRRFSVGLLSAVTNVL